VLIEESGIEKDFLPEDKEPEPIQEPEKVNEKPLPVRRKHQLRNNFC
jgi:hypothetical protein